MLNDHCRAYALYRNECRNISSLKNVTCIRTDLGKDNIEDIYKLFSESKIRAIVHLAANIDFYAKSKDLIQDNLLSLNDALQLAEKTKVDQFIYFSSVGVYGTDHKGSITEDSLTNCETLYHLTKLWGEQLLNLFCASRPNMKKLIFRLSSPIGVGMRDNLFLPAVVKAAMKNKDIMIYGKGTRIQNYIDVRDIVNTVKNSISSRLTGMYNLVSPKSYSNKEVSLICKEVLGSKSQIVHVDNDIHDKEKWVFNSDRIKKLREYSVEHELSDSILWLAKHYENSGI